MELIPIHLLAPVLLMVAYSDLRYLRIPNPLSIVALALFVVTMPLLDLGEIGWRMFGAVAVFGVGFAMFALRLVGGGDVKFLAVLMLFVPSHTYALFMLNFSATLLVGIAAILTLRVAPILQSSRFIAIKAKSRFPMGVSIALTGLTHPFVVAALNL